MCNIVYVPTATSDQNALPSGFVAAPCNHRHFPFGGIRSQDQAAVNIALSSTVTVKCIVSTADFSVLSFNQHE